MNFAGKVLLTSPTTRATDILTPKKNPTIVTAVEKVSLEKMFLELILKRVLSNKLQRSDLGVEKVSVSKTPEPAYISIPCRHYNSNGNPHNHSVQGSGVMGSIEGSRYCKIYS